MLDKLSDQIEKESDQAVNGVVQAIYELQRVANRWPEVDYVSANINKVEDAHTALGRIIKRIHSEAHLAHMEPAI